MTAATFTVPAPRLFDLPARAPVVTVSVVSVAGGVGATSIASGLRDGLPASVSVLDVGACVSCRGTVTGATVVVTRPDLIAEAVEMAHHMSAEVSAVLVSQITPRRLTRAERLAMRSSGAVLLPYADGGRPLDSTAWRRVVASLAEHLGG